MVGVRRKCTNNAKLARKEVKTLQHSGKGEKPHLFRVVVREMYLNQALKDKEDPIWQRQMKDDGGEALTNCQGPRLVV